MQATVEKTLVFKFIVRLDLVTSINVQKNNLDILG